MLLAMIDRYESRRYVVQDKSIAMLFFEPKHMRFIAPFIGQERQLKDVSEELKSNISTTYRRVKKYCDLGIIDIVKEEKRNGKAIKIYRAVADYFYIPHNLSNGIEATGMVWQEHWDRAFLDGFRHSYGNCVDDWGQLIYRKDGVFTAKLAANPNRELDMLEPNAPALFSRLHDTIYLNFSDAKALQKELNTVFDKYSKKTGNQRYMMQINFVALPKEAETVS